MECVFTEEKKKGETSVLTAILFVPDKEMVWIRFIERVAFPSDVLGGYFFHLCVPVDIFITEMESFVARLKKEV